ncbi:MAG: hypothetical protein WAV23_02975 [Minisyncoccia bacterium]
MIEEIILHRTQNIFSRQNLSSSFNRGYEMGYKSFEIDLYDADGLEIQVQHPNHSEKKKEFSTLSNVVNWASDKEVRIYLDIKYPLMWKRPFKYWLETFAKLDQNKFFILSFDIEIIKPIIQKVGLSFAYMNFKNFPNVDNDFYVIPYNLYENTYNVSAEKIIISDVSHGEQINRVLSLGVKRIMINSPYLIKHFT